MSSDFCVLNLVITLIHFVSKFSSGPICYNLYQGFKIQNYQCVLPKHRVSIKVTVVVFCTLFSSLYLSVLRIRDPVPFCPPDPGSGIGLSRIPPLLLRA
jgi:hypothetical protein